MSYKISLDKMLQKKYLIFIAVFFVIFTIFFFKIIKSLFLLPGIANILHLPIPVYGYQVSLKKSSFFLGADADIESFKRVDLFVPDYDVNDLIFVKKVFVKPGDVVFKGQNMIEFSCEELLVKKKFLLNSIINFEKEMKRRKEYLSNKRHELIKQKKYIISLKGKTERDLIQKRKYLSQIESLYKKKYISFLEYRSFIEELKILEEKIFDLNMQIENIDQELLQEEKKVEDELFNIQEKISSLKYDLTILDKKIKNTIIKSPIDGVVNNIFVQADQNVKIGSKIITISDISKLKVVAHISIIYLNKIFKGQKAFVKINNLNSEFESKLENIYPIVNSKTQTFDVELYLINKDKRILPGMTAFVRLGTQDKLLLIPKYCVTGTSDNPVVFIIKNTKAVAKRVILGDFFPYGMVEIKSGLNPGDIIIKSALRYINDGEKIRILGIEGKRE